MKKVKVVVSKVFNLFIYFILLLLIFVFAINLFSKDVNAQEINPLPITEVDYSQVGTLSFVLQPTNTQAKLYFIVPKFETSIYLKQTSSEFLLYYDDYYTIFDLVSSNDILLQSNSFASDIYIDWFGNDGTILLNHFDMYQYFGGNLTMPWRSEWSLSNGYLIQTISMNNSISSVVFEGGLSYTVGNNLQGLSALMLTYIQGYDNGYLANNVEQETLYNYAYSQGVQYASDIFQKEIQQLQSQHQSELALLEEEILTAKQQGFDEGVAYAYETPAIEQSILTFTGSILGSILSFIWLIITAPTIFGINLLTIILLLLTLFVVLTMLKIIF